MDQNSKKSLKAWETLINNRMAVLSTVSSGSIPQSSVIYYVNDEDFHLFMVTHKESQKAKNILENNKVSLVVVEEKNPIELQIAGTASVVEDPERKSYLSRRYLNVANKDNLAVNWPPIMKIPSGEGFIFFEITIEWFKYSDFSTESPTIIEGTPEDWK